MINFVSLDVGSQTTHWSVIGNYNTHVEVVLPQGSASAIRVKRIKGDIVTINSGRANFNDCFHYEGYGTISVPQATSDGNSVRVGLVDHCIKPENREADTESYKVVYDQTASLLNIAPDDHVYRPIGSAELVYAALTKWKQGTPRPTYSCRCIARMSGSYGVFGTVLRSFSTEREALDWVRDGAHDASNYDWSHSRSRTAKVIQAVEMREEYQELLSTLQLMKGHMKDESEVFLLKRRHRGFCDALTNNRTVHTLSICCQILADGLIVQALGEIYNKCGSLLSKTAKTLSRPKRKQVESLMELVKSFWDSLANADLAYVWGVKAPLRDYADLANALLSGDWHPYFDGSTVARLHETGPSGHLEHLLVYGVHYDYLHGSSIEDVMALIHQGGLDLTASELWDLIPLSFVPDWGRNFSQLLDDLQASMEYWRYPIEYFWETDKCTYDFTFRDSPVQVVLYRRREVPFPYVEQAIKVDGRSFWTDPDFTGTFQLRNVKEAVFLLYKLLS